LRTVCSVGVHRRLGKCGYVRTITVRYTANDGRSFVSVTFVYLLEITLAVMPRESHHSPLPLPPGHIISRVFLSQATTIGGRPLPSIMGARHRHLRSARGSRFDFLQTATFSMHCRDLTPILPLTQHPCMQPPSTTPSHPAHGMSATLIKLCFRNIPLKTTSTAHA